MSTRFAGAALLGIITLVAGCSQPAPKSAAPRPSPSRSSPPADGGWYSSTADLMAAMARAGVDCRRYEKIENASNGSLELGACYLDGDPSRDIPISIYASAADAADGVKAPASFGGTFLLGQNWTLNLGSNTAETEKLKVGLGGRLLRTTGAT